MMLTVPPTSAETQTSLPSGVQGGGAQRGRASTSTLASTVPVVVSMKCAMLVVSEVVHHHLAVRADRHAFRLDADGHCGQNLVLHHIEHRHLGVVFIGDIERITRGVERELFRVRPRLQRPHQLHRLRIENFDAIFIAGADIERLAVGADGDPARAPARRHGPNHFLGVAVDHADRIALFIGHVNADGPAPARARECRESGSGGKQEKRAYTLRISSQGVFLGLAPLQAAFGFRFIDPKRVERRALMQEARLRRDRHQGSWLRQQQRLSQLAIPGAKTDRYALERGKVEIGSKHIGHERARIAEIDMDHGFADARTAIQA